MKFRAALLAVALLTVSAFAAGPLEALRANARSVRDDVSALKAEQLAKRSELSQVSSRIEALKAQTKGRLLPGGELDAALKHSQELSGALTELAQRMSSRETELEAAQLALVEGLSQELARLRADFDRLNDRTQRRALIEQMKKVRAERDAVRATLPASKLPTMDALKPSDDPEELLEQADLLRDNEEKLRKELKAVETRIAERREEAELDRRVQRFMGEESMFDDQDRRLRVQRTTTFTAKDTSLPGRTGNEQQPANVGSQSDTAGAFNGAPNSLGGFTPQAAGTGSPETPAPSGNVDGQGVRVTNGSDARPQVGATNGNRIAGGDEDLDDLEVERAKLQGLADQLKKKAAELEGRAKNLR